MGGAGQRRGASRRGQERSAEQTEGAAPASGDCATHPGSGSAEAADPADPFDTPAKRPARSLKSRAIGYLSRREYSRLELARKLGPYCEEGDDLDTLLDVLERDGWLSDERFAQSLVHRRAGRFGASRIVGELKRNAVDAELVDTLDASLRESEWARAKAVWARKFGGQLPGTPAERGKQARFLAMRGFSHAIIGRLLRGRGGDEDEVFLDETPED
jgi:regulatory protein